MTEIYKPFWERSDLATSFLGVRQVENTCVFAASAGAVNHLTQRNVWTLGSLIDAAAKADCWKGGPAIGGIAHEPVKDVLAYRFNVRNGNGFEELKGFRVRQWVETEGKLVVLSCPLEFNGRQHGWHMISLVDWNDSLGCFVAWGSSGKMGPVYETEIESGVIYQAVPNTTQQIRLIPHPDHHAFVWGVKA